jgi:peptidoglycan/LPS O-acetylase OafA/YrhL
MEVRFTNNNFDFLRFLFALLVVISHAYALSGGTEDNIGISKISNGQLTFSQIGLNGFFIISGYFVFKSLQRSKSILEYYKKRFLRLFPGLIAVLLLTLILAPLLYINNTPFLQNIEVFTYIPYNLSLYGFQSSIKGIFDTNTYHSINGSLWTIRYEFTLYIALSILFFIKNQKKKILVLLSLVFFTFYILYNFFLPKFSGVSLLNLLGIHVLNLGTFFIAGSLLAAIELEAIRNRKIFLVVSIVLLVCSLYFNCYDLVKHILLPFFILLLGFTTISGFRDFGRLGDASYGIYIYSFPIQQTLMWFFKVNTSTLMIYSIPLSIAFGYLSWHYIEKRALELKKKLIF